MSTLEERVAYLEGRVEEHGRGMEELRDAVVGVDHKVDLFRAELATRIDGLDLKLDRRIDGLDQKVDRIREELAGRIDGLDQKVSKQFLWLLGVQVAVLLAVIGALLGP